MPFATALLARSGRNYVSSLAAKTRNVPHGRLTAALVVGQRRESTLNPFDRIGPQEIHTEKPYHISWRAVGPFAMNQYLIGCPETKIGAIIDCGSIPYKSMEDAKEANFTISALLITHGHLDHIAGLFSCRAILPNAPVYLHSGDAKVLLRAPEQATMFGLESATTLPQIDRDFKEYETVSVGNIKLKILHVPGHCPGHIALYDEENKNLFAGDILFKNSIGRTDLPASSTKDMADSVKLLMSLPDDVTVFPGHGPTTMIGIEKHHNPFVIDILA